MYSNVLKLQSRGVQKTLSRLMRLDSSLYAASNLNSSKIGFRENFASRHIGVSEKDEKLMLKTLNLSSLDELVAKTVPQNIYFNKSLNLSEPMTEQEFLEYAKKIASENQLYRSFIGMGYHNCFVPTVIQRNVFENPGWVTHLIKDSCFLIIFCIK